MTSPDILYHYPDPLPLLTIEKIGSRGTGRCLTETNYKIRSKRELTDNEIADLARCGVFSSGQALGVVGRERETHEVECVAMNTRTGQRLPGPAMNPYTGEPYKAAILTYHVALVRVTCDSGD